MTRTRCSGHVPSWPRSFVVNLHASRHSASLRAEMLMIICRGIWNGRIKPPIPLSVAEVLVGVYRSRNQTPGYAARSTLPSRRMLLTTRRWRQRVALCRYCFVSTRIAAIDSGDWCCRAGRIGMVEHIYCAWSEILVVFVVRHSSCLPFRLEGQSRRHTNSVRLAVAV